MNTTALICPECCPDLHAQGKMSRAWEISYRFPNDKTEKCRSCTNCGYTVQIQARNSSKLRDKPTAGQQKAIDKIRAHFSRYAPLAKDELKPTDYGTFWLSVETEGNVYQQQGGYFSISRRGKVECKAVYRLTTERRELEAHYTKIFNY